MTPAQKAALEGVVGRPLTDDEATAIAPLLPNREDNAIATLLSTDRTVLQSKYIGTGTILSKMRGQGGLFMDKLVEVGGQNRDVYWALDLLKAGRFDIGDPASQSQIDALAVAYPDFAVNLQEVKAVGRVAAPITVDEISNALNVAEGRMTL